MTSLDSGVDTGNDSNDSYATFERLSTTREDGPVELLTCVKNVAPATARELREQASGSQDINWRPYVEVSFQKNKYCNLVFVWLR